MSRSEKRSQMTKAKKRNLIIIAVVIVVVIVAVALFVLGSRNTVESNAKDKSEVIASFEKNFDKDYTDIKYRNNKIIIESRITEGMSPEDIKSFEVILNKESKELEEEMKPMIEILEQELGVEDITIEITYFDGEKNKILTKEYH